MKKVLKWASATFGLIPGLLIIATNLGTAPGISNYLMGGIITSCGAFTLIILNNRKSTFTLLTNMKLERSAISCFVMFIVFLILYIYIYNVQVSYSSRYNVSILFPFWSNADLQYMISHAGSKIGAIESYGPEAVLQAIRSSPTYISITKVIFILVYLLIFEFLTVGFGLAASMSKISFKAG